LQNLHTAPADQPPENSEPCLKSENPLCLFEVLTHCNLCRHPQRYSPPRTLSPVPSLVCFCGAGKRTLISRHFEGGETHGIQPCWPAHGPGPFHAGMEVPEWKWNLSSWPQRLRPSANSLRCLC